MTIIKTADLIGAALDWAVATIEGYGGLRRNPHAFDQSLIMNRKDGQCVLFSTLKFSEDWGIGGPIIERENIYLCGKRWQGGTWIGVINCPKGGMPIASKQGDTALIAAMRCYVASKLGDTIEVPDELA